MRDKETILNELRSIEVQMSPENLYMDGERPRAQARKIYKKLKTEQTKLQTELGYIPTFQQLYPR